ncbi:MAG TPA: hypothetical protein VEY30_09130, partial [Myxococcaceae bacterium]|nr:hypothetical protein [Myxococcaceae bacterium]
QQPAGYYADDGNWYPYPEGYWQDPNAYAAQGYDPAAYPQQEYYDPAAYPVEGAPPADSWEQPVMEASAEGAPLGNQVYDPGQQMAHGYGNAAWQEQPAEAAPVDFQAEPAPAQGLWVESAVPDIEDPLAHRYPRAEPVDDVPMVEAESIPETADAWVISSPMPELQLSEPEAEAVLAPPEPVPQPIQAQPEYSVDAAAPPPELQVLSAEVDEGTLPRIETQSLADLTQLHPAESYAGDEGVALELELPPEDDAPVPLASNADFLESDVLRSAGEQGAWTPGWTPAPPRASVEPPSQKVPAALELTQPAFIPPVPAPLPYDEVTAELSGSDLDALPEIELTEPVGSPFQAALVPEPASAIDTPAPLPPSGSAPLASPADDEPTGEMDLSEPVFDDRPQNPQHLVKGEHRVILHMLEGQVKRGLLRDVDLSLQTIPLETQNSALPENVSAERIKAVFFMLAAGDSPPPGAGRKVRVTFQDGRQLSGFSEDFRNSALGFFIIPAETRTNTARIFIYRTSIRALAEV